MTHKLNEQIQRRLRSYLRSLANRRNDGTVTADDAHTFLTRNGVKENLFRTRLAYIKSVLRSPEFYAVGSVPSERPAARGRSITEWSV